MKSIKVSLFNLLEELPRKSNAQHLVDVFLTVLILANVLAVILDSVETLSERYDTLFYALEVFSVAVFTIELLARLWVYKLTLKPESNQSYWKFWVNPFIIIDVIALVPFYLSFWFAVDLRLLRLLRLFRVFKSSSYFHSLRLLGSVIRQEFRPMLSAFAVILILMLFSAAGIYLLERQGQPDTFGDLPSALWWVVVTLSTVGYGDAVPLTVLGRILGAVIMMLGIGMVALPAGMLASRFSEVMHRQQDLFRQFAEHEIRSHGKVAEEVSEVRRQELFISRGEARSIVADCIQQSKKTVNYCPSCGEKLPSTK
jgi:voltage-gated potassium channel